MGDERVRELERRWRETQAPADEDAWIFERIRVGGLAFDPRPIRAKLERLREHDVQCKQPGAKTHRYQLDPCLSEAEVVELETLWGIRLSATYRTFLLELGSGGAGPHHGLVRLSLREGRPDFESFEDYGFWLGDVSQEFPHNATWNLPQSSWDEEPDWETLVDTPGEEAAHDAWADLQRERYHNTEHTNGAIPISEIGCALREFLVLNGPETGNVWIDKRADNEGLSPLTDDAGGRLDFLAWYERWLDTSLAELGDAR